jgi:hypothetical protein
MKGERAMGILAFQQMRDGRLDPNDLGAASASQFSAVSGTWLGQAYLNDDETKYIEIFDKLTNRSGDGIVRATICRAQRLAGLAKSQPEAETPPQRPSISRSLKTHRFP